MPSKLTLDMADPATKQLVDGWLDATEYTVTMTVRTGTGTSRNQCEVVGPIEETVPDMEMDHDMEEEAPDNPGPTAVMKAMRR